MKCILLGVVVASLLSVGCAGCTEKPPAKTEIKVVTPRGTTVTIEKPAEAAGAVPPSATP